MNKMKYFGIDFCDGQVFVFLCIRHRKNDRQHADGTDDGHDDACHRTFRYEYEGGKQYHRHHDPTSAGFLCNGHPGTTTPKAPRPTQSKPKMM